MTDENTSSYRQRYETYKENFLVHFTQAVERLNETPLLLPGEERQGRVARASADSRLMGCLVEYITLATTHDPFGELKGKIERAGENLKTLLSADMQKTAEAFSSTNKANAENLRLAIDEDVRADFDVMTAFVCSLETKERDAVGVLRDFYSTYLLRNRMDKLNEFCRRDFSFEDAKETGFPTLDALLDGGLYTGLYVLGAPSSSGKTSFCIQLSDQLAERGNKVLFFSLEMSADELVSKSLSRYTYLYDTSPTHRYAKSERRLTSGKYRKEFTESEWELLGKSANAYTKRVSSNLSIRESTGEYGVKEIERDVRDYIRNTGEKPVVFIDYLQILKPMADNMTDKQNTDRNVTALKRLCRDCSITLFVISSFNRASYNQVAGLESFKESGVIEYSADCVFSLQPKGITAAIESDKKAIAANRQTFDSTKKLLERPMCVTVLKNRRGKTGDSIDFMYNCVFGHFADIGEKKSM